MKAVTSAKLEAVENRKIANAMINEWRRRADPAWLNSKIAEQCAIIRKAQAEIDKFRSWHKAAPKKIKEYQKASEELKVKIIKLLHGKDIEQLVKLKMQIESLKAKLEAAGALES